MRKTSLVLALMAAWLTNRCAETASAAEPIGDQSAGAVGVADADGPAADSPDALLLAELEALVEPLPELRRVFTHTCRAGQVTSRVQAADARTAAALAGLPGEQLIYSNTNGPRILRFGSPNRRLADDLQTDALAGCDLGRYVVRVNGGVPNGTGEFTCKTALFDGCPSVSGGATLIPGTAATFAALSDDNTDFHDLIVDVSSQPIPIPLDLWVRVECNTAASGWVGAAPAETGFTNDVFFFPTTGCSSFLWSSFYCGFYAQIYAVDDPLAPCRTQYPAYATSEPIGWLEELPFSNTLFIEDFQSGLAPTGDTCVLSGYQIAASGNSGPFQMTTDLRGPWSATAIPGTSVTFSGRGDARAEFMRHRVDPALGIIVPAESLWMTWEADQGNTSVMLVDGAAIGYSDAYFRREPSCPLPLCHPLVDNLGTFYLKVFCRGEEATGACCTFDEGQSTASCVDNVLAVDCVEGRWAKYGKCADNPFDPPCGAAACCTTAELCLDLLENDCTAIGGFWDSALDCASADDTCGLFSCVGGVGECGQAHATPGCNVPACCNAVCSEDSACCTAAWDDDCLQVAALRTECAQVPQGTQCAAIPGSSEAGAIWMTVNSELTLDNSHATGTGDYCCGQPGTTGVGQLYFRFVATAATARISTCGTTPGDAGDSLLQVYRVGDATDEFSACNSLIPIACNDDRAGCGDGTMADLRVTALEQGETYYFTLASKTPADQGIYEVSLQSPGGGPGGNCAEGIVEWLAPTTGTVVDARQPVDPDNSSVPLGVTSVTVRVPFKALANECWNVCDTLGNPLGNDVVFASGSKDEATLHLQFPITAGAETVISYTNSGGCAESAGRFQYLPGDVNGHNGVSASEDAGNFPNWCLSGQAGIVMERCDMDRSGVLTSSDLIRLIDLMNGAGPFDPWLGRTVISGMCE